MSQNSARFAYREARSGEQGPRGRGAPVCGVCAHLKVPPPNANALASAASMPSKSRVRARWHHEFASAGWTDQPLLWGWLRLAQMHACSARGAVIHPDPLPAPQRSVMAA